MPAPLPPPTALSYPSLADYLRRQGRCAQPAALALLIDLLEQLHGLHVCGQLHGALDAQAVLLEPGALQLHALQGASGQGSVAADVQAALALLRQMLAGAAPQDGLEAVLAGEFASVQALRQALLACEGQDCALVTGERRATLDALLCRMRERSDFPALSDSVARIQRVADSEHDSLSDLTHEILKDVALTHKLLRLVNSVQYARADRGTISTVSRAVSLVGFTAVRNMALSLVLLEHLGNHAQAEQMRAGMLRAMLAGAVASELCPVRAEGEQAFIGAMFHNLGHLLCQFYFPAQAQHIRALQAQGQGEQAAVQQVLGLGLDDLGLGVARAWGLPEALQRCMHLPLGAPALRPPSQGAERLRWVARAANEVASSLLLLPDAALEAQLLKLATQYQRPLALAGADIVQCVQRGRRQFIALVQALQLPGSAGPALVQLLRAPPELPVSAAEDALAPLELPPTPAPQLPAVLHASAAQPPTPELVAQLLAAGVQDVAAALAAAAPRNEVLRMVLEAMYRALGVRRVVLALRDARAQTIAGRLGLGEDSDAAVQALRLPLGAGGDLFAAVCQRGADTLIRDAHEPALQARLPAWYRQGLNAPTFLLLPLQLHGQPLGLVYADHEQPGAIALDAHCLGLLRTLRNQALTALQQAR